MKRYSRSVTRSLIDDSERGQLIVFEGADGVGKSSLSKALVEKLCTAGVACKYESFPGKKEGTIGRLIYDLHHAPTRFSLGKTSAASLQALHIAAHLDAIEQRILPALMQGLWVVLDRFWWSTWVYGQAFSVERAILDAMIRVEHVQWDSIRPAVVFLIDRSTEAPDEGNFTQLRELYSTLFHQEKKKYPVCYVRNDLSIDKTVNDLLATLSDLCPSDELASLMPPYQSKSVEASEFQLQLEAPNYPAIFTRLSPAKPTVVYDTYWRFAAERQEVFWRKLNGLRAPWTTDPILREYKFTNTYRASDRVSQYLIGKVIYEGPRNAEDIFFRTILFKLFNKIETWELLQSRLGVITYVDYSFAAYDQVLTEALLRGDRIYSAAYIMPSGKTIFGHSKKHRNHLVLLERMMEDEAPQKVVDANTMRDAFEILASYPTIGSFLAYQFVTDLNYSELTDFSEMDFVVPGPGATDGLSKCFYSTGGLSDTDVIRLMTERQEKEFERLELEFSTLGGRALQLIDCQNIFCEVSKYARAKHPEFKGSKGRKRIKQIYRPSEKNLDYWYPPKWGINDQIHPQGGRDVFSR